jgi:hypothetical protein
MKDTARRTLMAAAISFVFVCTVLEGIPFLFRGGWLRHGHMAMFNLILFVYPLVLVPGIVGIATLFSWRSRVPYGTAIAISLTALLPQAVILWIYELQEYPGPTSHVDAERYEGLLILLSVFCILAIIASAATWAFSGFMSSRRRV